MRAPTHSSRRWLAIAWLTLAALVWVACPGPSAPAERTLWVHYFNDWHGHLEPFQRPGSVEPVGGAARLATLVAERRAAAASAGVDSVLLLAGDVLQGTPLSTVFRGEPDFHFLNGLGLDAMCLGNHEFDFGLPNLRARIEQASFPVLGANVVEEDGGPFTPASTVLNLASGLRVAVLGVVTADVPITTHRRNVEGLVFEDPVVAARRRVPELAAASDLVVVLSHSGLSVDRALAAIPGVDLVIGGHDQQHLDPPVAVGSTWITQAGEWGERLGEVRLAVASDGRVQAVENHFYPVHVGLAADPAVEARVAHYRSLLSDELDREIARAAVRLEGERDAVRRRETNLGNLVADAARLASQSDVALVNGGAIRASIEAGPIRLESVVQALPFDNALVVADLTGAELEAILARSARLRLEEEAAGGFLQLSGARVRFVGEAIDGVEINGAPMEPDRAYRIVTTDFLATGGDGYEELVPLIWTDTNYLLTDIVVRRLQSLQTIGLEPDGRLAIE